jgi:hypothetical protein
MIVVLEKQSGVMHVLCYYSWVLLLPYANKVASTLIVTSTVRNSVRILQSLASGVY